MEWLHQFFAVEPHDEEMLLPPAYITDNGGYIFTAKENDEVTNLPFAIADVKMEMSF